MNKKFLFPFLGLVLGVFMTGFVQSCIDDGNNDDDNIVVCLTESFYKGQLQVEQPPFKDDDVMVKFFRSSDVLGKIVMYNVKFAERMPLLEAMTIDGIGISVSAAADSLTLTGESIVPTAGDTSYPQFIMTDLQGIITQDSLIVSMKSGSMPLSFRGKRQ